MIKKILLASAIFAASTLLSQTEKLHVRTATGNPVRNFAPPNINSAIVSATDTLHYFFNKHFFRNSSSIIPPASAPENNLFYTVPSPYSTTLSLTHCGGIFNNSVSIQVTGLEGMASRNPGSASQSIMVRLYLCNVGLNNLPLFPPLDSVTTFLSNQQNGAFIGGNFVNPVTVNGKFAVLIKNASANPNDTISPFMNNASSVTSTVPARQRYGENLGLIRLNGNFVSTSQGFSGSGPDYEFIVAPRVSFNFSGGITVVNPTVCTNSQGKFNNTSTPVGILENRQFNFNKFYAYWSPWALTTNSLILNTQPDSIYDWTFTGGNINQSFVKNPTVVFNSSGVQNIGLTVSYRQSSGLGLQQSLTDVVTETISVSANSAPVIAVAGPSAICSGATATLTASGNNSFTWSPNTVSPFIIVTPNSTTVYSVSAENGGCISSRTVALLVSQAPVLTVISPTAVCVSSLFTLSASGANSFLWSNTSTSNSITVLSHTPGVASYTLTGTNPGCAPAVFIANVTVNDRPSVSIEPEKTTLCTKATGGTSITIYSDPFGGVFGNNTKDGIFTPNNPGTITATYSYTDASTGCARTATAAIVTKTCVLNPIGISESMMGEIAVFPNPAVDGKLLVKNLTGANLISVYNILGTVVFSELVHDPEYNINLSAHAEGQYILRITGQSGEVRTAKIVNRR